MPTRAAIPKSVPSSLSDPELARLVAAGDQLAFEALMRRHNRALYRVARAILKDDAEAEDALQLAYLHAYQAIGSFRAESRLSTWLTRIVVNEALMRARRRSRDGVVIPLEGAQLDDVNSGSMEKEDNAMERPEASAIRGETRALIERKIDALPDAFRAVFVLRAVEEMSVEETAACLGVPEATVRTRFFRARSLLRESLAREIDFAIDGVFAFDGSRCDRIVRGVLERLRPPHIT